MSSLVSVNGRLTVLVTLFMVLTACVAIQPPVDGETVSEWDFDHEVHFRYTKIDEQTHQLAVIPRSNVNFSRLSAFLIRKSYLICGTYGYKMEILQGVKSVDHNRASPNLIMPDLTANIECPVK